LADVGSSADAGLQAAVALREDADLHAARLVDSTVAQFAAVAGSTVAEVVFMAEVGSTVVAADMVAVDTAKCVRGLM
jgi:hypothetical protein